jgi:hypothetical protein
VASLNFNFNTQDTFGSRLKPILFKSTVSTNHNSSLENTQPLNTLDGRKTPLKLDEDAKARRDLNRMVLTNQYTYWAGMYVKRSPSSVKPLNYSCSKPLLYNVGGPSINSATDIRPEDDLSLINKQSFNFNRKKRPFLPEQEC